LGYAVAAEGAQGDGVRAAGMLLKDGLPFARD
jgi:hypothetical protein